MPAVPSSVIDPLWDQFQALLPERVVAHPLGCHRPRIPDRVVFDKLVQVLVLCAAYAKIADARPAQLPRSGTVAMSGSSWGSSRPSSSSLVEAFDRVVRLNLEDLVVDGCIVKAPCAGEAAGKSPVCRGKQGTKRSLLTDAGGTPLGCVVAPANRHDSPFLRPTLEKLGRFGFDLPEQITLHLDAGYDSKVTRELLDELNCDAVFGAKGTPLQAGARWVIERTNSWHNRGFKKLLGCAKRRARVIEAFIALANAIIIVRRLLRAAWTTHRWHTRPTRRP